LQSLDTQRGMHSLRARGLTTVYRRCGRSLSVDRNKLPLSEIAEGTGTEGRNGAFEAGFEHSAREVLETSGRSQTVWDAFKSTLEHHSADQKNWRPRFHQHLPRTTAHPGGRAGGRDPSGLPMAKSGGHSENVKFYIRPDQSLALPIEGITLIGSSTAGISTTVFMKEIGICFDAGKHHPSIEGARVFAVTHGHMDHIGGLHQILRIRGQTRAGAPKPHVVMPECYVDNWTAMMNTSMQIDAGPNGEANDASSVCNIVPTSTIEARELDVGLSRGNRLVSLPVDHRVPATSYVVYSTERVLLSKYKDLSSEEVGKRAARGEQVSTFREYPKIAFTGDTTIDGILQHDDLLRARVLVMECTFMCPRTRKNAADTKHVHLMDLADHADKFQNDMIVLIHVSERYTLRDALRRVAQLQSDVPCLRGRVAVWRGR